LPAVEIAHVLVPLDGSEFALRAMPTARVLAQRFGADIHTVTVASGADDARRARALAAAALDVPPEDDRVVVVTDGDPAETISKRAEMLERSVVCMATHGRGRLRGALMGSVARSVLNRCPVPMVVLGPMADNPGWTPRPRSWPDPLSVPRIVACVDGSDTSEQILPLATAWASALDMSVTILTVVGDEPVPSEQLTETGYGAHGDDEMYIDKLVQQWRRDLPDLDGEVVRDPIGPASAIRSHLDQRPAGLVALIAHGRSGIQRVLGGATAADIVYASVEPCLVAPVQT
jgi:nucleotide-binding universal stress UspA family protein